MGHISLGPGPEFDLVRALLARWGVLAKGAGDDAAVLDVPAGERLVVSTDTSVEDVHFRRDWLSVEEIGYRAVAAAMSDLAAMGARPLGMTVALSLPESWQAQTLGLADGMAVLARSTGTPIIGGDLTGGAVLTIGVTVLGSAPWNALLSRDRAQNGQTVWVTGVLGGPGAAVRSLLSDQLPLVQHRARFARPVPRIREAAWLLEHGATAAVDISDGLVADAAHLAAASNRRLVLSLDHLPLVADVTREEAARSGEEYELIVTGPADLDQAAFSEQFGIPLTPIGRVEPAASSGPDVVAWHRGRIITPPAGHDHFRL